MPLVYLVGADASLSVDVVDDAGSPVVGSDAVAVTVTDPAGGITSPVVSEAGSGAYTAIVPSVALPGNWLYRWVAPGFVYEGQFTVRAAGLESIVDLASVKAHLSIPTNDDRSDDEILGYIYAAGDIARDFCGPFLSESHTQWFDGGSTTVAVDWIPVGAIASVTEIYGLSAFAITEQELGGQMNAFAFTADRITGVLTRRTYGGDAALWAAGNKNIKVVYTAGSRAVPYTVRLGALELVRHLWQITQQPGRPKFGSYGSDTGDAVIPTGFALPNRVIELWGAFKRPPGIA